MNFPIGEESSNKDYWKYIEVLIDKTGYKWKDTRGKTKDHQENTINAINKSLAVLTKILDLSLRDLQKIMQHLVLLHKSLENSTVNRPEIIVILCILKVKYSKACNEVKLEKKTLKKSLEDIGILKKVADFVVDDRFSKQVIENFQVHVSALSMTSVEAQLLTPEERARDQFYDWMGSFGMNGAEDLRGIPAFICKRMDQFTPFS